MRETGKGSVGSIINHSFIVANYFKALTHGQRGTRNDDENEDGHAGEDGSSSKVLSSSVGSSVIWTSGTWHWQVMWRVSCTSSCPCCVATFHTRLRILDKT